MKTKWLYLLMLVLAMGCQPNKIVMASQDEPVSPDNEAPADSELEKELNIYRSTLFEGKSEQLRIDAAGMMLFKEEAEARKILLDALKQAENIDARAAVCKTLSQTRGIRKPIKNKEDFIQPILDILTGEDPVTGKLAAEATLIFDYDQISEHLEEIAADASLSVRARLNAVYALELHPDIRVTIKLIMLVDDPDSQVAAAAEKALDSMGIQTGKGIEARKQTINELERQGPEAFLRNLLIRQEGRIREMTVKLNLWQGLYLAALGRIYDGISDDAAKSKFLAEQLSSSEPMVKLWAIEKVYQWRVRPGSRLPAELGPILVNLISDASRDVRLKTARLLSLMGELNTAQPLLSQLEMEQDDEVRTELLVALGGACYYASLPDSPIKIPPEIHQQTLDWAAKYLLDTDPKKAQKGAEIVKKLLEQNSIVSGGVDRYLALLAERYERQKSKNEGTLRGELLNVMAGLCGQSSACRTKAIKLFGPLFEEALSNNQDSVREAAADGLISIDKTRALSRLRKDFVNDPSIIIRKKVISLAGEVGGEEDLTWLADKMGSNTETELSWQAMLKIFDGSDAVVLQEWMDKFGMEDSPIKLSDEQKVSFFEIAEQKADAEKESEMLRNVRRKLAELHRNNGEFERAADYLGRLYDDAATILEKEAILPDLLDVYLKWPKVQLAAKLVENCLLQKDLGPNSAVIQTVDNYLNAPLDGADPNAVLKAMSQINTPKNRPMWQQWLNVWMERLRDSKKGGNAGKTAANWGLFGG